MALQNSDLLVVQTDDAQKKLYKLSVSDLGTHLAGDAPTGTVETVKATLPLESDEDTETPTISSKQATSTTAGHVARVAIPADVDLSAAAPSTEAVVTANLLKATNQLVDANATNLGTLDTTVSNNTAAISQNASDITTNAGDISDNSVAISENTSDITGLDTRVATLEAVDSIDGGVYAP